jgi:predicted AAA+ superfamily ATPase
MSMMKRSELSRQVLTKLDRLLDRHVDALPGETDFTRHQAYRWDAQRKSLKPIKRPARIDHEDLIGIDAIKKEVNRNTKTFLHGARANNVLLWGERGTGKSSLIKSLLTTFEGTNLRMIQVFKHDLLTVLELYDLISDNAACRFIFFIDDLSFEEGQTDYQEMKTVIDGGLEAVPDNLLFYATSNRKHLVPTRFSDNESDEVRPSDTVEEKVSLVDRFGLRYGFYHVSQDTYLAIAASYAKKYNLPMKAERLDRLALQWALRAGGRNGRTAEQFVRAALDEIAG